jgi:transposase InsO family protein
VLAETPFHGEGYRKVWAKLRVEGLRTSKERVRRLMAAYQLQVAGRVGQAHGPKAHDGVIITDQPDVMWGTDATTTLTVKEGQAFVFVAVDHCNFECLGLHASAKGNRFEALEPLRQGVREQFGGYTQGIAVGLKIRHDHGSAYLADDFQQELKFLGMESSPSFVREPQGNGCAERFIRLLKENLLWVRSFETIEELRLALLEFKHTYNTQWLLERHGYQTQSRAEKKNRPHTWPRLRGELPSFPCPRSLGRYNRQGLAQPIHPTGKAAGHPGPSAPSAARAARAPRPAQQTRFCYARRQNRRL